MSLIRQSKFKSAARKFWAAVLALAVGIAASQSPAIGRDSGNSLPLIRDAEIEGLLRLYAKPIFKAAGINPASVRVYIISSPQINAFVAGGQRIFVNAGLISKSQTPNEVIGVLAHETGHIANGHLARMGDQLKRASAESIIGMLIGAAATIGGAAAGSGEAAQAGRGIIMGSQGAAQRGFLSYQREMEASADEAGLRFLTATGQSGRGMLDMFKLLSRESLATTQGVDPYLYSHPMPLDRIRALEARVKQSKSFGRRDDPALQLRHDLAKAKLAGFTEPLQQVLQEYPVSNTSLPARYARSIALFRRGDLKNALPVIDSLTQDLPQSPYFWELKGQALLENGQAARAIPALEKARSILPNNGLLQILQAQAEVGVGDPAHATKAISLLNAARQTEGDSPELFKVLAQAHALNHDVPRAELATAEYAYLTGDRDLAISKAQFALGQFKENTPEWLRASDLLAFAKRKK
jgi:predicted Zn-dependent protease